MVRLSETNHITSCRRRAKVRRLSCRVLLLLGFCFWVATLHAHDPGLSTATVRLGEDKLEAVLVFSVVDANQIVELDKNSDGQFSKEELAEGTKELQQMAAQALDVSFDDVPVRATDARCRFDENNNGSVYVSFPSKPFKKLVVRSKWLALLPPGHRQFFSLQNPNGDTLAERMLSANSDSVTIQMDPMQPATTRHTSSSFFEFLQMGVRHIWTGYDHLLFLFGLLIVARNFASSVKIITCFTIAHSITLAVATLRIIPVSDHTSSRVVEPLIAASIVYVGIENLLRGGQPKGRWLLTFAFGLIHGLGFASALRERGVGSDGKGIAIPLVSFNLGVEVGQIAIAAILLPLIWKLRAKPQFIQRWIPACSALVALLGGYWFVQRVWF